MWRVRVHQLRRVAHTVRCAACDRPGTRGAAAPVSYARKGEGWCGASLFLHQSGLLAATRAGDPCVRRGTGMPDLPYLSQYLPVASTRLPRRSRGYLASRDCSLSPHPHPRMIFGISRLPPVRARFNFSEPGAARVIG